MSEQRITFVGGGNMARSLIGALVRGGAPATAITVAEPNAELHQSFEPLRTTFAVMALLLGLVAAMHF